jgi:hypothetical protein
VQDKFKAVLSAIDNGLPTLENLDLWFSDSDTATLSVLFGCAHIAINAADKMTPIWLWQDGTCKCFPNIEDFERRMKQELDDGLVVRKGLACNRNHFNALVMPDFDSSYPDDNNDHAMFALDGQDGPDCDDFDSPYPDDNNDHAVVALDGQDGPDFDDQIHFNALVPIDFDSSLPETNNDSDVDMHHENDFGMNDGSDLDMVGHEEQAISVSNNHGMCGQNEPDFDEEHVEWMDASFRDLICLASPAGHDGQDYDEAHGEWMDASVVDQIRGMDACKATGPQHASEVPQLNNASMVPEVPQDASGAPSLMTPINRPMDLVDDLSTPSSFYDTPVNGKYPRKPGESATAKKARRRILKRQALGLEQRQEQKRKNRENTQRHRDKCKKVRYPHLNTKQPTPEPTKK